MCLGHPCLQPPRLQGNAEFPHVLLKISCHSQPHGCARRSRRASLPPEPGVGVSGRRKAVPKDPPLPGGPEAGSSLLGCLPRVGHWKVRGQRPPWPLGRGPRPLAGGRLDVGPPSSPRSTLPACPSALVSGSSAKIPLFFSLPVPCPLSPGGPWAHLPCVTFTLFFSHLPGFPCSDSATQA